MWGTPWPSRLTATSSVGPANVIVPSYCGKGARMMTASATPAVSASTRSPHSDPISHVRILLLRLLTVVAVPVDDSEGESVDDSGDDSAGISVGIETSFRRPER